MIPPEGPMYENKGNPNSAKEDRRKKLQTMGAAPNPDKSTIPGT